MPRLGPGSWAVTATPRSVEGSVASRLSAADVASVMSSVATATVAVTRTDAACTVTVTSAGEIGAEALPPIRMLKALATEVW
tara:strand:+ start:334 stop:579 length:246 start_codon:yes stop_codon:yes gene_type:complete